MTAPAVTNSFAASTLIESGKMNTNFSDLVTYISNRNSGTTAWDGLYVSTPDDSALSALIERSTAITSTNTTTLRIVNTSTGDMVDGFGSRLVFQIKDTAAVLNTIGIIDFERDGADNTGRLRISAFNAGTITNILSIDAAGDIGMISGGKFRLDGVSGTGDTYFVESSANVITCSVGGTNVFIVTATHFDPVGAGLVSSGTASDYWNDISYKTLTDRGCLGWFDEGVELADGRVVSDTEALLAIEKDETKQTIYGKPMLKYGSFPKVSYKKEDAGDDGIEMTSMFSIMIGAIRELTNRVKVLEAVS